MQVLCKLSNDTPDLHCATCGEGFRLYYTRTSPSERHDSLRLVQQTLHEQHLTHAPGEPVHPKSSFNVPSWNGPARFSAAALLGCVPDWAM